MKLPFSIKSHITSYEVTPSFTIKPYALLNILQNAADGAVHDMKLTMTDVLDLGCAWMVHGYEIHLDRPVVKGDDITVYTGHCPHKDLYSIRRFSLYDGEDNYIGMADSKWILVDLKTRKPKRLSHVLPDNFYRYSVPEFDFKFDSPVGPEGGDSWKFDVRITDLDVNLHVNNAHYLGWVSDAIPSSVYLNYGLVDARITFKKEATFGMSLEMITQGLPQEEALPEDVSFSHSIVQGDGSEITRLNTRWRKVARSPLEIHP